jgi:anti-sigma factor RsiW
MIHDDLRQKLNDYVDGVLSAVEVEEVEALLADNPEAQAEVAFLKQLAHDVSALPLVIAPEHDLWAGVASGIGLQQKLNDYVDDVLSAAEVQDVEAFLVNNHDAQAEVAFLRQLARESALLPRVMAPKRDLWAGVADQLVQKRVLPWRRWASFAAAAVLLVAASSAITVLYMKQSIDVPHVIVQAQKETSPALAAFEASEQSYSTAIAQLTETLHQRREALAPETVAAIETNLKVIDEAIRASRLALDADPHNQASVHMILAMYKRKVDLLQQIVGLPHGG